MDENVGASRELDHAVARRRVAGDRDDAVLALHAEPDRRHPEALVVLDTAGEHAPRLRLEPPADVDLLDRVRGGVGRPLSHVRRQCARIGASELDVGAVDAEEAGLDHGGRAGRPDDGQVAPTAAVPRRQHQVAEVADVVPVEVREEQAVEAERVDAGPDEVDGRPLAAVEEQDLVADEHRLARVSALRVGDRRARAEDGKPHAAHRVSRYLHASASVTTSP